MQDYVLYLKILCCFYLHICLVPCAIAQTTGNVSEIVSMTGEVEVFHQNIWRQAEVRQLLYQGDHVRTGENGFAKILANDGSRIHVNQNSLLILKEVAESAGVGAGQIHADQTLPLSIVPLEIR